MSTGNERPGLNDTATTSPVYETAVPGKVIALIIILAISFIGNSMVIIVVHRSRRNQWTTNHFVLNLAVVNLLAPTLYLSVMLSRVLHGQWGFGNFGCKLWAFLQQFNVLVSVGILCCLSVDRYYLTAYPLKFKLSKTQTKKLIAAIWLLAGCVCSPLFHFFLLDSQKTRHTCRAKSSSKWTAYVFTFASLFLVMHLATYVMYFKVYLCILSRNRKSASLNQRFASKVPRTKIKVTRLLVVQLVVHTLLWLPFIFYQIISSLSVFVKDSHTASTLTLYTAYTSSGASPIVYAVFSGDFRRGCKQILMKYDASTAYRIPAQLERKNRVDIINSDINSGQFVRWTAVKRDSREQARGMTFEQPKIAWSN